MGENFKANEIKGLVFLSGFQNGDKISKRIKSRDWCFLAVFKMGVRFQSESKFLVSRLEVLTQRTEVAVRLVGGEIYNDTYYPAWQSDMASALLAKSLPIYKRLFDEEPVVEIIHAGLECGVIGDKISKMDMLSIGPTIRYPHSPDEKIHIGSIGRVWDFLRELLGELR